MTRVLSGCLSGRGQAESEQGGRVDKTLVQQMEEAYSSLPVRLPEVNPALRTLYQDWLQGQDSQQTSKLLHTQYKTQSQSHTQPPHMQWWGGYVKETMDLGLGGGGGGLPLVDSAWTISSIKLRTVLVNEPMQQFFHLATGGPHLYLDRADHLCQI